MAASRRNQATNLIEFSNPSLVSERGQIARRALERPARFESRAFEKPLRFNDRQPKPDKKRATQKRLHLYLFLNFLSLHLFLANKITLYLLDPQILQHKKARFSSFWTPLEDLPPDSALKAASSGLRANKK